MYNKLSWYLEMENHVLRHHESFKKCPLINHTNIFYRMFEISFPYKINMSSVAYGSERNYNDHFKNGKTWLSDIRTSIIKYYTRTCFVVVAINSALLIIVV